MTDESIKLCLIAGYLMTALDNYLTPGVRGGIFEKFGRRELRVNPKTEDIEPGQLTTFFPAVTALAINKGIPAEVVEGFITTARETCDEMLKIPGMIDDLKRLHAVANRVQNAERRARNN